MKLVFTPSFERDTENILSYYKINDLESVIVKFNVEINDCVNFLAEFPLAFPVVPRNKKYRKKLFRHLPYKIYYKVEEDRLIFARLRHVRRKTLSLRR